jgi:predicted alpha/beta hydrolase family esterase
MPTKKKKVLFLHSAGPQGPHQGSGDFIAHLKAGLGSGFSLKCPKVPHPESPDYATWKAKLAKEMAGLEDGVILIGHSLGGSVLAKYLSEERIGIRIAALCLAATPFWGEKGWEYQPFYLKEGFGKKLSRIPRIFLYHSKDDKVVAPGHVRRYAEALPKATVRLVKGRGHAFEKEGLPELVEDLLSLG